VVTSRQPVGEQATTGLSMANKTILTTMAAPQPWHIRCPGASSISFLERSFNLSDVVIMLLCGLQSYCRKLMYFFGKTFVLCPAISIISLITEETCSGMKSRPPNP